MFVCLVMSVAQRKILSASSSTEPQRLYGEQGLLQISYTKCDTNKIDDPNSMQEACHKTHKGSCSQ